MAVANHTHPEAATKAEVSDTFGELRGDFRELRGDFGNLRREFGDLKAEVAEIRGRLDLLIWGTGLGFAVVLAMSAVFRYVG